MRFFKRYILLTLFLFENGVDGFSYDDLPKDCGRSKYNHEVFNGVSSALVGEFPWIVRVGVSEKNKKNFYCTGSLIHPSYVVTTAHCGEESNIVRLGENILDREKDCYLGVCAPPHQDIRIRHHIFSNHSRITNTSDISLLSLEDPAEISDFVRPVCLPKPEIPLDVLKKERTITAGWGVVDNKKLIVGESLKYMESPVLNHERCSGNYKRELEQNELCAGHPEGVKSSCVVDSGGPLMALMQPGEGSRKRKYLVGIASHDLQKCQNGSLSPVIYAEVSSRVSWMLEEIEIDIKNTKSRK